MPPVLRCKTLSVSIERTPRHVYAFVSNPENLPKWATAFCRSVRKSEGEWIVETPDGPMRIRFVGHNEFGVLDHYVNPAPGLQILNPMRMVANGSGSEVSSPCSSRPICRRRHLPKMQDWSNAI